jgi:RNase P subunit RPR2
VPGQQFICKKCATLSDVRTFEQTTDKVPFVRCTQCGARNRVVNTGATPSQPGLLPVSELLD